MVHLQSAFASVISVDLTLTDLQMPVATPGIALGVRILDSNAYVPGMFFDRRSPRPHTTAGAQSRGEAVAGSV